MINQLADYFYLTESEREKTLPSGNQRVLDNRVGWARTYLTKAVLLTSPRRAHFIITERGQAALADPANQINSQYFQQFDEFVAFKQKSNDNTEQATTVDNEITPDEALSAAYQKINAALAEDILSRTRKVTLDFLETLLIDLLLAMGYGGTGEGAAHALGKTGDKGVDGVIDQGPLGVDQIYIQAKRYDAGNTVGASDIRNFFGALNLKKAQKGIFITTSDFSVSARQTANELGTRIALINGNELAKLMLRYNIGSLYEDVLYLNKIDEYFFNC